MHAVVAWLAQYGYFGLALGVFFESAGLPLPGETALLAAAFAAGHGALSLPLVIAIAAVAAVLGDNLGYVIGRRLGRPWLERHGRRLLITPARLDRVDRFFHRFGGWAVALARFVTGVRVLAAVSAGAARMPWATFFRFNVMGAVIWAAVMGLIGFGAGRGWQRLGSVAGHAALVLLVIVPAALGSAWAFRRLRRWWQAAGETHWTRTLAWQWVWVTATSLTAILMFAKVAEDVTERESASFDDAIRAWALAHESPLLSGLCRAGTLLGTARVLVPLTLLAVAWLWRRTGARLAATVLLSPVLAAGGVLGLKALFARDRPPGAVALHALGYSFPSGHTTAATAVALTLGYVLAREGAPKLAAAGVAVTAALVVGWTRVCLDVHWATDVIGGWSAGLLVATACAALYEWLRGVRPEPAP